jgi:lipopolysaccharide export system permease protein
MLTSTDRYIARLIAVPLIASLVIAAMLLVLDKMLRLFDFVAKEGGPVSVVWQMLVNVLPEYLSLGIPIGLLLGIMMAFRKIALSSELDVFLAVGKSYERLLRVPYLFAIGLALINFLIVGFVQPQSRYAYEKLQFELRSGALGASIKVGEFVRFGKNKSMTLRIEKSLNDGKDLRGIFVRAEGKNGQMLSVTAKTGTFLATEDRETILLRLGEGVLVHNKPSFSKPRTLSFNSHDLPIPLPKLENFRTSGGQNREMTIPQLFQVGLDKKQPEKTRNQTRANFHFRIVEVVMMLLLPLLAVALAVPPKRSSSALGIFLSIVMVVTYHKLNQFAEGVGARGDVDPLIALWVPFFLFAGLILWLYWTLAHKPGGQPIGGLEKVFSQIGKAVRSLLVRSNKPAEAH